ncbi:MAG: hypothetical protein MJ193_01355, partial [Clostridia bacterium]|nr:hypothetical protein [Clostridia bacterium]
MRKQKLLFLILVLLVGLAIFAACNRTEVNNATSISIIGGKEVIAIGEFYYEDYSLAVTYVDGTTKIVALTEDMLPATEKIKLLQEGKHTLTVSAFGQTCEFGIEVKRRTIDNATFEYMSNATNYVQATYDENRGWYHFEAVYTGDPYVVNVGGLLPDGYSVNFPEGNSFTNAGEYEISAIISCSQYASKTIYALVTIDKADYDFSELKFENKVYEYDGTMKYLNYEGKLPEGLTGKYYIGGNASGVDMVEGNGAEKAGIYYVALVISGGDKNNYNDIVNPYAILNIKKKEINIDDLQWTESEFVYDSNPHEVRIWDQNIPEGLNPAISYEDNIKYEAGTYTAIAKLSVLDPANYTVQPYVEKEFVIKQAEYDLSEISFESTIADYDGEEKVLECTFGKEDYELPQGLTIEYSENRFTNVGVYEVTVTFKNEDVNFITPEPMSANLVILAQKHALSEYSFPSVEYSYDGNEHELPTILNLPEYFSAEYTYSYSFISEGSLGMTENGYIVKPAIDEDGYVVEAANPDTYTVFAKVSVVDENYAIEGVDEVSATLKIFAPAINMYPYEIGFVEPEKPFAFNGQTQGVALAIPENSAYDLTVSKYEGKEPKKIQEVENCSAETTYGGIVPGKYQVTIVLYYPAYKEDMIANKTAMEASMEFEIVNAVYTKENFAMENKIVEFNGEVQGVEIEELPFGVTVTYSMVPRGEIETAPNMTKPGIYDVTATIKVDDEYKAYIESIDSVTATLMVTKCEINLTKASVLAEYAYDTNYSVYPYNNEGNEVFPFTTDRNDIMTKPKQAIGLSGNFELGNITINYWFTLKKEGGDTKQHAYAIDQIDPDTIIGNYSVYLNFNAIDTDCIDMKLDGVLVSKDTTEILMYEFAITPTATINISGLSLSSDTRYFDFSSHTYALSGTIPQHVNVKYTYTVGTDTTVKEGNSFE